MAKKIIRITENDIKEMVVGVLKTTLEETNQDANQEINGPDDIDVSKLSIEDLKQIYRDLRLPLVQTSYDDVLNAPTKINEAYGDLLPPDNVVDMIVKKYALPPASAIKREANHKVYIYLIVGCIGINDILIEEDMKKVGYFLGHKSDPQTINGMTFQVLQFEPTSQMQVDVTDEIESKFDVLFHWTPQYSLQGILENGLTPSHKNAKFNYPPRVYLMNGSDKNKLIALGQSLCSANQDKRNNGKYSLLAVMLPLKDDSIRFFYDPNSEIGIYTEQKIPKEAIKLVDNFTFGILRTP